GPVLGAQFGRDLESAKCLDLVLWRAVPDGVGAPEHVVLAAVFHEFAERMCSVVRVAHEKAPGAAELGVNVAVRLDAVFHQRADKGVDAVARAAPGVGALGDASDETRVIDEKAHVRKALRRNADVAALAVLVGLTAEGQSLVHADHLPAKT